MTQFEHAAQQIADVQNGRTHPAFEVYSSIHNIPAEVFDKAILGGDYRLLTISGNPAEYVLKSALLLCYFEYLQIIDEGTGAYADEIQTHYKQLYEIGYSCEHVTELYNKMQAVRSAMTEAGRIALTEQLMSIAGLTEYEADNTEEAITKAGVIGSIYIDCLNSNLAAFDSLIGAIKTYEAQPVEEQETADKPSPYIPLDVMAYDLNSKGAEADYRTQSAGAITKAWYSMQDAPLNISGMFENIKTFTTWVC